MRYLPKTDFKTQELSNLGYSHSQQSPSTLLLLHVKDEWVFWKEDNILWLPLDYRPKCCAIKSNILALGHESGRVTLIEFNPDHMPVRRNSLKRSYGDMH